MQGWVINRYKPSIVAATGGVLQEKVFLEVSQNLQENTCARVSFLIRLQLKLKATARNFIKKETLVQVFCCEFCEILWTTFLQNTSGRLLPEPYFFYKQLVYMQRTLGWQIAKQLSGIKHFSLRNNKNYRLKKSGFFSVVTNVK